MYLTTKQKSIQSYTTSRSHYFSSAHVCIVDVLIQVNIEMHHCHNFWSWSRTALLLTSNKRNFGCILSFANIDKGYIIRHFCRNKLKENIQYVVAIANRISYKFSYKLQPKKLYMNFAMEKLYKPLQFMGSNSTDL